MKTLKFSIGLIVLFMLFSVGVTEAKLNEEFTKKFHEEYTADKSTLLKIKNKFGDVSMEDWDKNQVVISVVITVKTESEEKAKKIFDRINISISKEGNLISAITEIDEKIINPGSKFQINYSLKVPQYIKLELGNKFGNVFINDLSGHVNLNIAYGNLMINRLLRADETPLNEISLAYCNKASISEIAKAKILIKYSKMELLCTDKLVLNSKYSKVTIEKANTLITEAAYDSYWLGEVRDFSTVGKYCDYSIDKITRNIEIEIKYGNFSVDFVAPEFESIKSDSKYGKVNFGISENASYRIDAKVEYGGIDYPESDKLSRIKDGSETSLKGIIGVKSSPTSNVIVNAKYGSVNLNYEPVDQD